MNCNRELVNAASQGQLELVKKLIEQNDADVNSNESDSSPPLISAARYGRAEVVQYLLKNGAGFNARTRDGRTAYCL